MKIQSFRKVLAALAIAAGLSTMVQAEEYRGLLGEGGVVGSGLGQPNGVLGTGILRSHRDDNYDRSNDRRDRRYDNRRNENRSDNNNKRDKRNNQ
jgi:hypothetical protein